MCALRQKKKKLTKQRLIEAAAAEFAEVGYARANISRISEKADYAAGTVYNYFRSKHELLVAVLSRAMEMLTEQIQEEIAEIIDPVEKAKRAIQVDFEFMERNEALSKVIIREGFAADPKRQKEILAALAPASEIFVQILEEGKREGLIRSDIDSVWATVLADGMVAYILLARWALEDEKMTYQEMSDLMIKCFVEGVLAK
jgi:AcrR family transcriptional regulator